MVIVAIDSGSDHNPAVLLRGAGPDVEHGVDERAVKPLHLPIVASGCTP